jgi:hypothetical protein
LTIVLLARTPAGILLSKCTRRGWCCLTGVAPGLQVGGELCATSCNDTDSSPR